MSVNVESHFVLISPFFSFPSRQLHRSYAAQFSVLSDVPGVFTIHIAPSVNRHHHHGTTTVPSLCPVRCAQAGFDLKAMSVCDGKTVIPGRCCNEQLTAASPTYGSDYRGPTLSQSTHPHTPTHRGVRETTF